MRQAHTRGEQRHKRMSLKTKRRAGKLTHIGPPHSDLAGWLMRLQDAFGTNSQDAALAQLNAIMNALRPSEGHLSDVTANAALAVVDGARPRDEIEAMLVGQMAVTHVLAMELMGRTHRADYAPQFESAGNMAVKLLRTFTAQTEALAKLRRGGEQTVRVEHVHVHQGGQAIVGNVTQPGGGGERKSGDQPHAQAIAHAPVTPLWSQDPQRKPVPRAGDAERAMSDARGPVPGSTEG